MINATCFSDIVMTMLPLKLLLLLHLICRLGRGYPHQHLCADPTIFLLFGPIKSSAGMEYLNDGEAGPSGTKD